MDLSKTPRTRDAQPQRSCWGHINLHPKGEQDQAHLKEGFSRINHPLHALSSTRQNQNVTGSEIDGLLDTAGWRKLSTFYPSHFQLGIENVLPTYNPAMSTRTPPEVAVAIEPSHYSAVPLGYFVSGAAAGVVSRTVTAPLDRIKVQLIANVELTKRDLSITRDGSLFVPSKKLGQPLVEAYRTLWNSGGTRNLFAGNGLNVVKVVPELGIKFGSFEASKKIFAQLEGHDEPWNINPISKFVSGGLAGGISQLFVYPIDTLKFRMQCETTDGGLRGNKLILATAKKMLSQGALKTSYRGLPAGVLGIFPYSAIDLGTFEYLKKSIAQRNSRIRGCCEADAAPNPFTLGFVGALSGTIGAVTVYPINVLRTRYQAQGTIMHPRTYVSLCDVAQKTMKNEGLKGFYKGMTPNLIKIVPSIGITYMVYEESKKLLHLQ